MCVCGYIFVRVTLCVWVPDVAWRGFCEHYIVCFFLSNTGPWMDTFGLGDAAKHIGTPQSIAIRNPDCTVATHLINLVSGCGNELQVLK